MTAAPGTSPAAAAAPETTTAAAPVLSVVRGTPTTEELAALVTALVAVQSARAAEDQAAGVAGAIRSAWSSRSRLMRDPLTPGPGAWRASALPR